MQFADAVSAVAFMAVFAFVMPPHRVLDNLLDHGMSMLDVTVRVLFAVGLWLVMIVPPGSPEQRSPSWRFSVLFAVISVGVVKLGESLRASSGFQQHWTWGGILLATHAAIGVLLGATAFYGGSLRAPAVIAARWLVTTSSLLLAQQTFVGIASYTMWLNEGKKKYGWAFNSTVAWIQVGCALVILVAGLLLTYAANLSLWYTVVGSAIAFVLLAEIPLCFLTLKHGRAAMVAEEAGRGEGGEEEQRRREALHQPYEGYLYVTPLWRRYLWIPAVGLAALILGIILRYGGNYSNWYLSGGVILFGVCLILWLTLMYMNVGADSTAPSRPKHKVAGQLTRPGKPPPQSGSVLAGGADSPRRRIIMPRGRSTPTFGAR